MGVDAAPRKPVASAQAPVHAGRAAPAGDDAHEDAALPAATAPMSPYNFSAVDPAGHMRKLEEMEAEMIRMAIARYQGHMSEVARRLGIGRSTLYRKLKDFGLDQHALEGGGQADEDERRASAG